MTVSVSLVSSALAQTWVDRLLPRLHEEGLVLSLAELRAHVAQVWGAQDWPTLMTRRADHHEAGVAVVDYAPFTAAHLKGWIKALHRRLRTAGHRLPLTRLQALWAQGMGGSGWSGLVHHLSTLNQKRMAKARALPTWPHLEGVIYPREFSLESWPAVVMDRIWELGQRWVDCRGSQARWVKFWPRIEQCERCLLVDLGHAGFFDDLEPATKGKRLPPLPALPASLGPSIEQVTLAFRQFVLPHDDVWAALRLLQNQAPEALRVPADAFPEWIELLAGTTRSRWSPFGQTVRQEACREVVARHAPAVAAHPSFHLVDQWAHTLVNELIKQRRTFIHCGESMAWPPLVQLYSEGSKTTAQGLPEHWCLRIEQS